MRAFINTRFMDAAPFNVNFKFNLAAKDGAFNYSGELGKFDGKILDKLVKPLAMVHVESADIEKLDFNVNASNYSGKGNLEFYYHNLNIQLLKKVVGKKELQKQGFISALANNLIIESNNPDKKGVLRPGPIDLQREPDVSFFSFLYKALLDGIKPSVGFDKKTETDVNTAIVKVSNLVNKINEFKEKRKARREEHKKERQAKRDSLNKVKENKGS
jgi:FtsZ-binding cell division protein ZapB